MKKLILALVVLALAAAIGFRFVALGKKEESQSIQDVHREAGVPVEAAEVKVQDLELWRDFTGTVEGIRQVEVFTNVGARVQQILKGVGDPVRRGEVVVRMDPTSGDQTQTMWEKARLDADAAQRHRDRIRQLYEAGAVSKAEMEAAEDALALARAALRDTAQDLDVVSPIDGVVTKVLCEVGDNAAGGQPLAVVADTSQVRIQLDVSQADLKGVEVGQQARCKHETNGTRCAFGRVTKVALSADPVTRLFAVEVTMDNPHGNLKAGVIETVEILVAAASDARVVPPGAIIIKPEGEFTYRIDEAGTARLVPVKSGIWTSDLVELVEGPAPGDRVVTFGQNLLRDGVKVNVRPAAGT